MHKHLPVLFVNAALACCFASPADAALYRLAVTYTSPAILFGPVSFGLDSLPSSVTSHFSLDGSQFVLTDGGIEAGLPAVQKGFVRFGDGEWSTPTNFYLLFSIFDDGSIEYRDLSYTFAPIDTRTAASGGVLNSDFVLHVVGVDKATGDPFEYQYNVASPVLTPAPEPASWAMILVGVGGLGAALRSRRTATA